MSKGTKYWTWHMAAGVVILFLLGQHMLVMHMGSMTNLAVTDHAEEAISKANSMFRDGQMYFTISYVLLLAVGLYHGLYGLRTILLELTLKPVTEKAVTVLLVVVGLGLFTLGTWAAFAAHTVAAAAGARG
jgi:succinate dehydrogenase/fumarate reductase cytochrome b subunit